MPRIPGRERGSGLISDETFMRGLAIGALIGAAIAGSTIWTRVHRAADKPDEAPTPQEAPG
jgi:hypothetical protein